MGKQIGQAMFRIVEKSDNGKEVTIKAKVSRDNASGLNELAKTGRLETSIGIESPYAILSVEGQIAEFVVNYENIEFGDNPVFKNCPDYEKESYVMGMIESDIQTVTNYQQHINY